jgi:hypothetical protein
LIILTILGEECKLWIPSLCSFSVKEKYISLFIGHYEVQLYISGLMCHAIYFMVY